MACTEGPRKENPDVTQAIEKKPAVPLSVPVTITLLMRHSADVTGKDADQRYMYIKVPSYYNDNLLHSAMPTSSEFLISKHKSSAGCDGRYEFL